MAAEVVQLQTPANNDWDAVRRKSKKAEEMFKDLPMLQALMGGTDSMRKAGSTHLPMWQAEDPLYYETRLQKATLFPAYSRTCEVLAAKPFSKPITLSEKLSTRVQDLCKNIDNQGRSLHVFGAALLEHALAYGMSGIMVDAPNTKQVPTERADGQLSVADEQKYNIRPYFVMIRAEDILGWKVKYDNGKPVLTQLRLLECAVEEEGEFHDKQVEQIRVLEPGKWTTYRKRSAGDGRQEWAKFEDGTTKLKVIPFVPVYGQYEGFMCSKPPLIDVAFMNVEHWQSKSDQQTILHIARVPILCAIGGDDKTQIKVGANAAINVAIGGDIKFVEHSGRAIGAGKESLADLEEQMRQAGAELLVLKPGDVTATQIHSENEAGMCALQRIALDCENAMDQALKIMSEWLGDTVVEDGAVKLFNDYGAATLAEASLDLLIKMNMSSKLSDETLFKEAQRRGMVSAEIKWDEELDRID
jgi:hypothetical protein